jgi:hypothetical protein
MPKAGNPSRQEARLRYIALFLLMAVITLFAARIQSLPTGYLHSWNQVGTLVHVRSVFQNIHSWMTPHDVVTRVVWEESLGGVRPADRDVRYRTFEEFPLYHLISGSIAKTNNNEVLSAKIVSVCLFFFGLYFLYRLIPPQSETLEKVCVISCALTSFPLLYYGQATMSDIGMLSFLSCSVFYISRHIHTSNKRDLIIASLALMVSTLFKSYSVVFAPLLSIGIFIALRKQGRFSSSSFILSSVGTSLLSALPVLLWHYWTFIQVGHHEQSSHTISNKIATLTSLELYTTLAKMYFRYLGYLGGGILLIEIFRNKCRLPVRTWWLVSWLLIATLYLLLTVDKLLDHDYYFLPILPPFIFLSGFAIAKFLRTTSAPIVAGCCLIFLIDFGVSAKSFLKATRENPDVLPCAKLLIEHTREDEFFASLTDISRFSSLAYFGDRLAIQVEEDHFPIERYRKAGASYLLLNLTPQRHQELTPWIRDNSKAISEIVNLTDVKDFKGRPRICTLYHINGSGV